MSSISDIIKKATAGNNGPAIEAVKRYIHNKGAGLGVCKSYRGDPGPEPTLAELGQLVAMLRSKHGGVTDALQDWLCIEQRRLSPSIPTSGLVISPRVTKSVWQDAAVKADECLNALKSLGRSEPPSVDYEDEIILRALARRAPHRLTQYDIEAEGVSRKTVGKRLQNLEQKGWVIRPEGPKSGTTITEEGGKILEQIGTKTTR